MRISYAGAIDPDLRLALGDHIHLALGSRTQRLKRLTIERDGDRVAINAEATDGHDHAAEAWHGDPLRAAAQALDHLRRDLGRKPTGVIRVPLVRPR